MWYGGGSMSFIGLTSAEALKRSTQEKQCEVCKEFNPPTELAVKQIIGRERLVCTSCHEQLKDAY